MPQHVLFQVLLLMQGVDRGEVALLNLAQDFLNSELQNVLLQALLVLLATVKFFYSSSTTALKMHSLSTCYSLVQVLDDMYPSCPLQRHCFVVCQKVLSCL